VFLEVAEVPGLVKTLLRSSYNESCAVPELEDVIR